MLDHLEISMSARIRKSIEKTLAADETTRYTFVKLSCPYEDKNSDKEQGDSKASTTIQRVSAVFMGSARNGSLE
ncbi:MAG: hypothetical protein QUS12_15235 [Methanosarcina sp.]|nr:hypothetical protein [Methanosarcina sp.]